VCIGISGFSALDLGGDLGSHKELVNVEHEIVIGESVKMDVNVHSTDSNKIRPGGADAELGKTEEGGSMDIKSSQPVNQPKEPISPFRSFLRPHERQHKFAGTDTRRQLPGGSMATPARDIA